MQLRPSASQIWTKCPANPLMASRVPEEAPGDPAREGTCAAWVAEMVLTGEARQASDMIGRNHLNGWLVEPDMTHRIQKYVDLVRSYGGTVHTERKVELNHQIKGTPDAYAILAADGMLHVDDLKYGYGIVEPYRNPQVSIYAGAILRYLTARGVVIRQVVIGIYQPRAWHPAGIHRTWTVTPEALMSYVHEIEAAGDRAQAADPVAVPGAHCEYCPAAGTCPATTAANYRVYDMLCASQQRHMSATELAEELRFLAEADDMLKGRIRALHAEAKARIERAEHIPGWHMEQGVGHRRFKVSAAAIRAMTGINPEVPKMVTPSELERMGANPAIVARMVETPRLAPQLKPVRPNYFNNLFKQR
jgi:hypothetical protein